MKNNYKFWIIFSLIIVFLAGSVGGIFLDKHLFQKKTEKARIKKRHVHFPTLDRMAQELNLTSEQEEHIRKIFGNNEERLKILRSHMYERLSKIRSQLKKEIEDVLTLEQKEKFEAMIEKYISQRKKEREKGKKYSRKYKNKNSNRDEK